MSLKRSDLKPGMVVRCIGTTWGEQVQGKKFLITGIEGPYLKDKALEDCSKYLYKGQSGFMKIPMTDDIVIEDLEIVHNRAIPWL